MRRSLAVLATASICLFSLPSFAADQANQLTEKKDKISYSLGIDFGQAIQKQNISINPDVFLKGLQDGLVSQFNLMPEDEVKQTVLMVQTEIFERQKAQFKEMASKNLAEGQKFLADNKKQKGIKTTTSGLQYRVLQEGKGKAPKATDTIVAHYRGKLLNGSQFDSSYDRGEPVKFQVNGVIPGWTEALQLMKPGAKWELFIPPELGYGEQGVGSLIAPNSTLIFEVELLDVLPEKTATPKS